MWRAKLPRCSDSLLKLQLKKAVGSSNNLYLHKWILRDRSGHMCSVVGVLISHCPGVCGKCSACNRCADSRGIFVWNQQGEVKDCSGYKMKARKLQTVQQIKKIDDLPFNMQCLQVKEARRCQVESKKRKERERWHWGKAMKKMRIATIVQYDGALYV